MLQTGKMREVEEGLPHEAPLKWSQHRNKKTILSIKKLCSKKLIQTHTYTGTYAYFFGYTTYSNPKLSHNGILSGFCHLMSCHLIVLAYPTKRHEGWNLFCLTLGKRQRTPRTRDFVTSHLTNIGWSMHKGLHAVQLSLMHMRRLRKLLITKQIYLLSWGRE